MAKGEKGMGRRDFIKGTAAALGVAATCGPEGCGEPPQPIEVREGHETKFTVAAVEFSLRLLTGRQGEVKARNDNDTAVKVSVARTDGTGVLLDNDWISPGKETQANKVDFERGMFVKVKVQIWKKGMDLAACPFTDASCFQGGDEKEIQIN